MSELPRLTRQKSAERTARAERLAKALRDNLRRRKDQARAQERLVDPQPRSRPDRENEPPT